MAISPWLRFGLPLGHALLLVAILDSVILFINMFKEFGIYLYYTYISETYIYDVHDLIFPSILVVLKLVSNVVFLWIGGIFMGNPWMLLAYVFATGIFGLTIAGNIIAETWKEFLYLYYMLIVAITCIYQMTVAVACYNALKNRETLQPIGKGVLYIWEYFNNDLQAAAKFVLASELIVDVYYLVSRQFLKDIFGVHLHGFEGSNLHIIVAEQLIIKCVRIVWNTVGLVLILKEKRQAFRWWCCVSLLLVLVSATIFVILAMTWRGEDIVSTLGLLLMFPGHLLYRCFVLYFCFLYTRVNFSRMVL